MISDKLRHKGKFWTDAWTIVKGCTPVSEGCANCWAAAMAHRFGACLDGIELTTASGHWTGKVFADYDALEKPGGEKNPKIYAVWNDLFHPDVDDKFIILAWHVMAQNPRHTFIIITKRPERAVRWARQHCIKPLGNVWFMGTTETQKRLEERVGHILRFPAVVKGIMIEPMLGPVDLPSSGAFGCDCDNDEQCLGTCSYSRKVLNNFTPAPRGLDWVICGGESGPGARPMHPDWARQLRDDCVAVGVPFFFKQWGEWISEGQAGIAQADVELWNWERIMKLRYGRVPGWMHIGDHKCSYIRVGKKKAGREIDGKVWDELPADLRVREMPR